MTCSAGGSARFRGPSTAGSGDHCMWIAEFKSKKLALLILSELTQAARKATASKERSHHMLFTKKSAKPSAKPAAKPVKKSAKPCKSKGC